MKKGDIAPDFTLQDKDGQEVSLSSFRGRKVVLYFYPKDNTPGCTRQAVAFAENFAEFERRGLVVIGISKDSVDSHKRFAEKYSLPFPILSDSTLEVITAYGVLKPSTDGTPSKSLVRSTYLIDGEGVIVRAFGAVKAKENADQMLEEI